MTTISEQYVNQGSRPADLKITDMRVVNLKGVVRATLIRIDTNQGISGYGEVRDMASPTYVLMLKSRILGENPCNVDKVFRKIKQFGYHARQAGGVCAIEMALMDLAGKAYGVPAYMLAGGKFRDKILCYSDTPSEPDGKAMGKRLKERMNQGFKFLKMDLGIYMLRNIPGTLIGFPDNIDSFHIMHPFTGTQITAKGIDVLCQYVADVRTVIGYEVPLAIDHFGHIGLESCIRLGQALDPFSLAWYEDMIPWQFTDQYVTLSRAVKTPICTGEDIYLKEGFMPLFQERAVSVIHPDLASAGGILETKKIGDLAQEHGIAMAMHMAGSPIAALAAVHCAAATENFLVLENHSVDHPEWNDFVRGLPNPLIQDGYIQVPETPGLGFSDVNAEMLRAHIDPDRPGYFEPTTEWDNEKSWDRLWS
ncbi:MAG TPA: mandelate racemase/muconate lactonizing enzyme family protein [Anaerolineae bacterium]|nr:mandelate racemase/muconate lactonizing enzyme family protein [Anaerolineae bacterium]HQH39755.1 mandelate racemase/muconate lactonizing enzyme family protein [Anaerolineae bacterium]